jgi:hypothetical protein
VSFSVGENLGTFGDAIRTSTLTALVESLTENNTLWVKDSRGYHSFQPTTSTTHSGTRTTIGHTPQVDLNRVRSHATGTACSLLIVHATLPPCISPLLLTAAMLMRPDRATLVEPRFLNILYPAEPLVTLFRHSSPQTPLGPLVPFLEAGDVRVRILLVVNDILIRVFSATTTNVLGIGTYTKISFSRRRWLSSASQDLVEGVIPMIPFAVPLFVE